MSLVKGILGPIKRSAKGGGLADAAVTAKKSPRAARIGLAFMRKLLWPGAS